MRATDRGTANEQQPDSDEYRMRPLDILNYEWCLSLSEEISFQPLPERV